MTGKFEVRLRDREKVAPTTGMVTVATNMRGPLYDAFITLCNIEQRSAAGQLRYLVMRALEERQEEIEARMAEEFPEPR